LGSEREIAMDELYQRQESLGIVRDQTVLVVGCGGIGSWVGYFLGLAGVERLELFDSDTISDHNLNRLPFTPAHIGRYKSEALAELIRSARPEVQVRAHGNFEPESHSDELSRADAVVVSTDSLRSRRMVYNAANAAPRRRRGRFEMAIPKYYELGADGHGASVSGAPAEWSTEAENEPGYQSVPVFVGPCTLAASIASYYILMGLPIPDTFRADWKDGLQIRQYAEV
jgi:ThiF family protein